MKTKNQKIERRVITLPVELRAATDDKPEMIVGHGAVFNELSLDLGGFKEQIAPGAFDGVLDDPDTRGLLNHDTSLLLGRNGKTMSLAVDDVGLRYEIEPGDTSVGRDTVVHLKRGDIDQSSFGFTVQADHWDERGEGDDTELIRTITKVGRLYDVSPVTFPAYPQAGAAVRSLDLWNQEHGTEFRIESTTDNKVTIKDDDDIVAVRKVLQETQTTVEELTATLDEVRQENENLRAAYDGMKKLINTNS